VRRPQGAQHCRASTGGLRGGHAEISYNFGMCIICVELAKQSMTPADARRALREMTSKLDQAHIAEVEAEIAAKAKQAGSGTGKP